MAKLTIQGYFDKLRAAGQTLAEEDMPLEIAARDTVAEMFNRIFVDGKNSKGSGIGKYNTTNPLYVGADPNKNQTPRGVKPIGKNGDTGDVGEKPRKTAYFESYAALRANQGVNTKYVDLNFSGRLGFNFVNSSVSTSSGTIKGVVSANSVRLEKIDKVGYVIRLNKENFAKARGNESRFRARIFSATKEERENFKKVMKFEIIRLANNA